jgi:hypothetical protein
MIRELRDGALATAWGVFAEIAFSLLLGLLGCAIFLLVLLILG